MGVEIIQARGDKREREVGGWECDKIDQRLKILILHGNRNKGDGHSHNYQ